MNLIRQKTIVLSALSGILLAGWCFPVSGVDSVPSVSRGQTKDALFPDKASGDEAYKNNEFAVAASFYRQYRQEAEKTGKRDAVKESFKLEIDSLLRAGLADQAAVLLSTYKSRFPEADPVSIAIWQANIHILKHEIEKADKLLTGLEDKIQASDMHRNQIYEFTAYVRERQKRYKEAADLYSKLAGSGGKSYRSLARAALMLIAYGDTDKAIGTMNEMNPDNADDLLVIQFMNFYLAQKKGNSSIDTWKTLYHDNTVKKDGLMYTITGLIADEFLRNKDYDHAAEAEKLAFDAAESEKEANDTLTRVIRIYQEAGNGKQAAALADRQVEIFRKDAPIPVKLDIGKLLSSNGKMKSAFRVYESVFIPPLKGSDDDLENAFRTVFGHLLSLQEWSGAEQIAGIYNKNVRKSPGFPDLCKAQILEAKGLKKDAAEAYRKTAERHAEFRFDAYWHAMELFSGLKEYKSSAELAEYFLKNSPSSPAVFYRAEAAEAAGNHKLALQSYAALIKLSDKAVSNVLKAQAYYRIGVIQTGMGNFDDAVKNFSVVLKQKPYSETEFAPAAGYWIIHTYGVQGKDLESEEEFRYLQKNFPQSEYTYSATIWLSSNFSAQGYWDRAKKILLSITGENAPSVFRVRALYENALILYRQKKFAEAELKLNEIEQNKLVPDALNGARIAFLYGDIHREQQKMDSALADYVKSAGLLPNTIIAQGATGAAADCLWAKGDYKRAFDMYRELLKMPNLLGEYRAMALYKAGRCQQMQGNAKDAADLYVELLGLVRAQDAAKCPVKTIWIVKGAEALVGQAEEKWGDRRIERAIMALDWLQEAKLLPENIVNERKKNIKNNIEYIREDIHK